eukprot:14953003-Alexandrium_andersonii.AAC.1
MEVDSEAKAELLKSLAKPDDPGDPSASLPNLPNKALPPKPGGKPPKERGPYDVARSAVTK